MSKTHAVTTFGAHPHGGAASGFSVGDISVLVSGHGAEHTEPAFELACRLSRIEDTEDALARATEELARARERLSAIDKPNPKRLLGPGYVRFAFGEPGTGLWVLNGLKHGWGEFGMWFRGGWDDLFRTFNVRVTEHGSDSVGEWWKVESI